MGRFPFPLSINGADISATAKSCCVADIFEQLHYQYLIEQLYFSLCA